MWPRWHVRRAICAVACAAYAEHCRRVAAYFTRHRQTLSPDSQHRLEAGHVLRILDSKCAVDAPVIANAPRMLDYASPAARVHYARVLRGLDVLGIRYVEDPCLVRGLDYYAQTVFEFLDCSDPQARWSVLAGGRYDGLLQRLSDRANLSVPSIGFAAGAERLALMIRDAATRKHLEAPLPTVAVVDVGVGPTADPAELPATAAACLRACDVLRRTAAWSVQFNGYRGCPEAKGSRVDKQLMLAYRGGAAVAVLIGEHEVATGTVILRHLRGDQQQWRVSAAALVQHVRKLIADGALEEAGGDGGVHRVH